MVLDEFKNTCIDLIKMISVNLDNLIKDYEKDLLTKLRGFGSENQYIEHWVPGTTKADSLYNLINSFVEANQFIFSISFGKNNKELSSNIMTYSGKIGRLEKSENDENIIINFEIDKNKFDENFKKKIQVRKAYKGEDFSEIKKVISPTVAKFLSEDFKESITRMNINHLKNNKKIVPKDCKHYFFNILNSEVHIYININDYKINFACHELQDVKEENIVVDLFIDNIVGKSIQEAAEHSVIYLEHFLRPKIVEEKVKGIILPHNGGRIFQELNISLRKIYSKFKSDLGLKDIINKEFTQTSEKWTAYDTKRKEELVNDVIKNFVLKELNLGENDIILNRIEINFRIIVELSANFRERQENENMLFKVEKILHNKIDKRLELLTMEIKDQNKLRFKNLKKNL